MLINEIFTSIDGEVNHWSQGCFTTFIRLAGCNLRCKYCDTVRAQTEKGALNFSVHEIVNNVLDRGVGKVTITGGEPLFQKKELMELMVLLFENGIRISVETNGTFPIPLIPRNNHNRLSWVVDYKLEYADKMSFIPDYLTNDDYVKIVITCYEDYFKAVKYIKSIKTKANIYLSPMHGKINPADLVAELKNDNLYHVGINLQIHKFIWPDGKEE